MQWLFQFPLPYKSFWIYSAFQKFLLGHSLKITNTLGSLHTSLPQYSISQWQYQETVHVTHTRKGKIWNCTKMTRYILFSPSPPYMTPSFLFRCPYIGAYASIGPLPHGLGRLTITGACLQPGDPKWENKKFYQTKVRSKRALVCSTSTVTFLM